MKKLILTLALAASPALAQQPGAQLPDQAACNAVRERVQLALGQADRALQAENTEDVQHWSTVAANYSTVYAAFCGAVDEPE
jgi:hypothetical protein